MVVVDIETLRLEATVMWKEAGLQTFVLGLPGNSVVDSAPRPRILLLEKSKNIAPAF